MHIKHTLRKRLKKGDTTDKLLKITRTKSIVLFIKRETEQLIMYKRPLNAKLLYFIVNGLKTEDLIVTLPFHITQK